MCERQYVTPYILRLLFYSQGELNDSTFAINADVILTNVAQQARHAGKIKWTFSIEDCEVHLKTTEILPVKISAQEFR